MASCSIDAVGEEWRGLSQFPDYQVSSFGRVRCVATRRYLRPGDVIATHTLSTGYVVACLDGRNRLVHRLVAMAFHGEPPGQTYEVAHCNGKRADNRPSNLRWATHKDNCADVKIHGTANPPRGEMQGRSKLASVDVKRIRECLKSGVRQRVLALEFGVARSTISSIATSKNWRHL